MRLGLIARADSRGLGVQTKAFHDHMHPTKTLVVDCPSQKPLPIRRHWYRDNAEWIRGLPADRDLIRFLDGLDVVYTAECAYNDNLYPLARERGVRTVLHLNYEFLDKRVKPTVFAAPSLWHWDDIPDPKVFLPVPIELHRLPRTETGERRHFLHIVGRPAIHDRNGTADLFKALRYVTEQVTVTMKCQDHNYLKDLAAQHRIPPNVDLRLDSGDVENYWDNYTRGDVLVMPRRFGGLCLPANEALGSGMPVIMPDISPNNLWLPDEWLVPTTANGSFRAKQPIDLHTVDHRALAALMDKFCSETWLKEQQAQADTLAEDLSWTALKPTYERALR